jgi:hypothetical protein
MNGKLEGSLGSLLEALSEHLPGGAKENNRNLSQNSRYSDRYSNLAPPDCKSAALPLDQPIELAVP